MTLNFEKTDVDSKFKLSGSPMETTSPIVKLSIETLTQETMPVV